MSVGERLMEPSAGWSLSSGGRRGGQPGAVGDIIGLVNTRHGLINPQLGSIVVTMREVISVHIGQAGCQMGNACW
jgi:hypothetical protein